ncbi:MAG: M15 family metallopeptidase [Oscillospiraceae bacterium]
MDIFMLCEGFSAETLPENIVQKISGVSFHSNRDVRLSDLSYLQVRYIDFSGETQNGELICAKKLAKELLQIFRELYHIKYPIEKICLVDKYNADDEKSMGDNNTSCFNYRVVEDTNVISMHGYGRAVDINPLYNPYIVGSKVMPANGKPYADRTKDFSYKIDENDECYKIFKAHGWLWGGHWTSSKDYQHFYKPFGKVRKAIIKMKKAI